MGKWHRTLWVGVTAGSLWACSTADGPKSAVGTDAAVGESPATGDVDAAVPPAPVRFVVIGDSGTGSADQYAVAEAIEAKCAADGCDFVVMLGDNIYQSGVASTEDIQWQEKFELPYQDLDVPFYPVLGNHDYGGFIGIDGLGGYESGGLGNEWHKGPIEVEYSQASDKWTMPSTFYTLKWGNVGFVMLDTNSLLWGDTSHGDQRQWYQSALMELEDADWIIQAGHHPYRSNGSHGNAGDYESIEINGGEVKLVDIPVPISQVNGEKVKAFFDDVVCGTIDISMSGHDHNRQWLDEPEALCGAELIVSGAGAKVKSFKDRGNAYHWQDDQLEGFLYVHVDGNVLTGQFIDKNGNVDFERTLTK